MPLETPRTTHGLISIRTSYHFKSFCSKFDEFHTEFDVCSLLQFHDHAEIANVKAHVVTNTRVVQLPMFTVTPRGIQSGDAPCSQAQRTHSCTAFGWRSMELVSKLFDTLSYTPFPILPYFWARHKFVSMTIKTHLCT